FCGFIEGKRADVFSIQQDFTAQLALIVIGNQTIYQPCKSCFSATRLPAEKYDLTIWNYKVDMFQSTCIFSSSIAKVDFFQLNHRCPPLFQKKAHPTKDSHQNKKDVQQSKSYFANICTFTW